MNTIEKAIIFATEAHAGVTRKGKTRPYILHPIEAMTIVVASLKMKPFLLLRSSMMLWKIPI